MQFLKTWVWWIKTWWSSWDQWRLHFKQIIPVLQAHRLGEPPITWQPAFLSRSESWSLDDAVVEMSPPSSPLMQNWAKVQTMDPGNLLETSERLFPKHHHSRTLPGHLQDNSRTFPRPKHGPEDCFRIPSRNSPGPFQDHNRIPPGPFQDHLL